MRSVATRRARGRRARGRWARGRWARRLSWIVLGLWIAIGLAADVLASDRPIVTHLDGHTYLLPGIIHYRALAGLTGQSLSDRLGPDDWAIWPPVRHDPTQVRTGGQLEVLAGPSARHWLGTDDCGRDVLARLVHGTRVALELMAGAALVSTALGAALALLALGGPRWLDGGVVAACDVVAAVPAVLIVVASRGLVGGGGAVILIVLIALPRVADCARLARGAMAGALAAPYAEAARAVGASRARVLLRHALPGAVRPLVVAAAITAAGAVLAEAALGFLGFGLPAPTATWGELLRQANDNGLAWHLAVPAGLAITSLAAALAALAQPAPEAGGRSSSAPTAGS